MMQSPYKGLMPYNEEDAPFFFGRAAEQEIIIANLNVSRLTLLYGESGVGKSSVLRAGIAHQLRQDARQNLHERGTPEFGVVVFSSWRDDPVAGLIRRVEDEVARTIAVETHGVQGLDARESAPKPALPVASLPIQTQDLASLLETNAQRVGGDLYIVLDQFEEYFLYHPDDGGEGLTGDQRSFADEFTRVLNREDLRVNFLLAIREDALAKLDRFKGRVPNLFDNYLRMAHLDVAAAREAIVKPLEEYNRQHGNGSQGRDTKTTVSIEPALVAAVLEQTRTGQVIVGEAGRGAVEREVGDEIETPYLQLVMTRLWDEEQRAGSDTLRLETLEQLGGAEKIVRTHLDTTMSALPEPEQQVAASIFNFLVTPSGTKIAHSARDLAEYAEMPPGEIAPTLEKLSSGDVRILRPVAPPLDRPNEPRYEIFHDVLGAPILDWRTRFVQGQEKAASELKLASERKRVRRLRLGLVGLSLLLLAVIALAAFALTQREAAARASAEALSQRDAAQKAQSEANAQKELAEQEKKNAEAAQAEAVAQQKLARSGELAALSLGQLEVDPERAVLIAREGVNTAQTAQAAAALRTALADPFRLTFKGAGGFSIRNALITPDGRYVVSLEVCDRNVQFIFTCAPIRVWDAQSGTLVSEIRSEAGTNSMDLSPDGHFLVTADEDTAARVWEIPSGKLVSELRGHQEAINDARFSPNGKQVVTASDDRTARVWDAATGKLVHELTGHDFGVKVAAFSPDGRYIVTGTFGFGPGWDNEDGVDYLFIWDPRSGVLESKLEYVSQYLEFSPDSQFIAVWTDRVSPSIISLNSKNRVAQVRDAPGKVNSLAFSPDGKFILTGNQDGTLRLYDALTGLNRGTLLAHGKGVNAAIFSPNGKFIISAGGDNRARWWQFRGNEFGGGGAGAGGGPGGVGGAATADTIIEPLQELNGHTGTLNAVEFSTDGQSIITASDDGTARLWHVNAGTALEGHNDFVKQTVFRADGKQFATSSKDGTARVWDAVTHETMFELLGHTGAINSIAYSSDGMYIVTTGDDGIARLWDSADGKLVTELRGHEGPVITAQFSPDSKTVATGGEDERVRIWAVPGGTLVTNVTAGRTQFPNNYIPYSIAFSPDGKHLAVASSIPGLLGGLPRLPVFEITTGASVQTLRTSGQLFYLVAYSPDGKRIATASRPNSTSGHSVGTVWDVESGKAIAVLRGHTLGFNNIAFSPDGSLVLTGSWDKTARIWDAATGRLLHELKGHTAEINRAAFSPDGRFLITASNDGTARVWETATGKLIDILRGHSGIVSDASFSPDGKTIVTTGDNTARLYECVACAPLEELVTIADSRITRELTCEERVTFLRDTVECK